MLKMKNKKEELDNEIKDRLKVIKNKKKSNSSKQGWKKFRSSYKLGNLKKSINRDLDIKEVLVCIDKAIN